MSTSLGLSENSFWGQLKEPLFEICGRFSNCSQLRYRYLIIRLYDIHSLSSIYVSRKRIQASFYRLKFETGVVYGTVGLFNS